jgi:hypothetical protein
MYCSRRRGESKYKDVRAPKGRAAYCTEQSIPPDGAPLGGSIGLTGDAAGAGAAVGEFAGAASGAAFVGTGASVLLLSLGVVAVGEHW